jgi:Transposase DDE domain
MPLGIGDIRVEARGAWVIERIVATGSLVLRKVGGSRSGEQAVRRYLDSPYVSVEAIAAEAAARTAEQCQGLHIVAMQDTTEINFAGASRRRQGLGPGGNGSDPGFFIHPVIAVDAKAEAVIGLVHADIWTRPRAGIESARWQAANDATAQRLAGAASITMVGDRENDLYPVLAHKPPNMELIIRAAQDRALANGKGYLFGALAPEPVLGMMVVEVPARGPGDKGRKAHVALKAGRVRIACPHKRREAALAKEIELTLVEAREIDPPSPKGALCWRILTTRQVGCAKAAKDIIALYRLRWRIEQVFRMMKRDGLRIEATQVTQGRRLFHLAALALTAAVRTLQLVDAREGSTRPSSDAIDDVFIAPLERISKSLQGKTERQKNPHPKGSLAWLAWIVARLGGWNCYYKPPGPKTMRSGWSSLAAHLAGYTLAMAEADP